MLLRTTRDIILTCSENRRLLAPLFNFSENGFLVTNIDFKNNSNCPGQTIFHFTIVLNIQNRVSDPIWNASIKLKFYFHIRILALQFQRRILTYTYIHIYRTNGKNDTIS